MIVYLDSSAVGKLLVDEDESDALVAHLDLRAREPGGIVASSTLLETELRRMAHRVGFSQQAATGVLRRLTIVDMERETFHEAGLMLPASNLRSLDALHIATAEHITADEFISYDSRQIDSAVARGMNVVVPR
ncbi:type II toxin-antitoxin system VapC family toxin [Subtercola endophyticus]|uniref:type II toxin-antitoxin system VapC family toxin n=1 Tax=Subtercola endophyticus TaxID=2895559 RepID=UPI001E359A43|nr:type II toxin-antitoxin system VapC family toxin [Subtercola endophyticus]UFS58889.1 type II toxin-antitoxin system VapC family toxin [Subtercola endophyticus]